MMKKSRFLPSATRRVNLTPSRTTKVDPEVVRDALGAEEKFAVPFAGSAAALAVLRSSLALGLRSDGGRPALAGMSRRQKVPMTEADWRSLEEISIRVSAGGMGASPGQIAAQLLHDAIASVATPCTASKQGEKSPKDSPDHSSRLPSTCDVKAERRLTLAKALIKAEKRAAA
jgi:hypothetical protein